MDWKYFKITRNNIVRLFTALTMVAVMAGCSDDDKDIEVALPEFTDIQTAEGEQVPIQFNADGVWTMSSDKMWCEIPVGEHTGVAGQNTVTLNITSAAIDFSNADVATVTFAIGNKTETFKVERAPRIMEMAFVDVDNNTVDIETEIFQIKENATLGNQYRQIIKVTANFDWELNMENIPDFINTSSLENINAEIGETKSFWLVGDATKFMVEGVAGELEFLLKQDKTKSVKLPVGVPSLDENFIQFAFEEEELAEKVFFKADGDLDGFEGRFLYLNVTSSSSDYGIIRLNRTIEGLNKQEYFRSVATWLRIDQHTNAMGRAQTPVSNKRHSLSVLDNEGGERSAVVMLLPAGVMAGINAANPINDLTTSDRSAIKEEYLQYVILDANQYDKSLMRLMPNEINPAHEAIRRFGHATDLDGISEADLITAYGTDNVYVVDIDGTNIQDDGAAFAVNVIQVGHRWTTDENKYLQTLAYVDDAEQTTWLKIEAQRFIDTHDVTQIEYQPYDDFISLYPQDNPTVARQAVVKIYTMTGNDGQGNPIPGELFGAIIVNNIPAVSE